MTQLTACIVLCIPKKFVNSLKKHFKRRTFFYLLFFLANFVFGLNSTPLKQTNYLQGLNIKC